MDERALRIRVGVVVLAAGVITGLLVLLFGRDQSLFQRKYTVYIRFPSAPGVSVDTPIRKHGVLIGRVAALELRDQGDVVVTARIDQGRVLRENEVCRIRSASLLGDSILEFVPRLEPGGSDKIIPPETLIGDGLVASDPLQAITNLETDVRRAIGSFELASNKIGLLADNLNRTLGADNDQVGRILQKSELALDSFNRTMATIDQVVGDPQLRDGLKRSLADMPQMFDEVRLTMAETRRLLSGFEEVTGSAQRNLRNLEGLTKPLGERGDELIAALNSTVGNFNLLAQQLVEFSNAVNSSDGTIGQLLHDRQLYDDLLQTTNNLKQMSRKLEPILNDVRIFTDKIATDPRQLGAAGLLDGRPPGAGLKFGVTE